MKKKIELLAPARDAQVAMAAIDHGADAVYIGAAHHGARAAAGNSLDEIARVCDYAHQFGVKVYSTVNTLIYDEELLEVEKLVGSLYRVGVDALIVQDMGLLRLDLPPIDLHASTQCDIRTPQKAAFLAGLGFSQLVLARELTLQEIAAIRAAVPDDVTLEAFVHGALCVCYSGRCAASFATKGRSANRGECAQLCRLPYDLLDERGNVLQKARHLLSLRDLNQLSLLPQLLAAGVSSLKIEGRLKDAGYVKNVVAAYRRALDAIISHGTLYCRASFGASRVTFEPDVERSFNRGFTHYFLTDRHPQQGELASLRTPKSQGKAIGEAISCHGRTLRLRMMEPLAAGDGISYFTPQGEYCGVRVNSVVDDHTVMLGEARDIPAGTQLLRTRDKHFDDVLSRPSAERKIRLTAQLTYADGRLTLTLTDERGCEASITEEATLQPAERPQTERQQMELGKLGNTIYIMWSAEVVGQYFVTASMLSRLRREAVEALNQAWKRQRSREKRRPERTDVPPFATTLYAADNVANHLARRVYADHGIAVAEPAMEVAGEQPHKGREVMRTRYCLRRELGMCLKHTAKNESPQRLYLRCDDIRFALSFDCKNCEMSVLLD